MSKNNIFLILNTLFLSFYSINVSATDGQDPVSTEIPLEQLDTPFIANSEAEDSSGPNRQIILPEQLFSALASAGSVCSNVFSFSATVSALKDAKPDMEFTNNFWKDITDITSKGLGVAAVITDWKAERASRDKFFSFKDLEPLTLTFAASSGMLGGVLSFAANIDGYSDTDCTDQGHSCFKIAFAILKQL